MRSLVYTDYPEQWPGLLPQVVAYLTSQVRAGQSEAVPGWQCGAGDSGFWEDAVIWLAGKEAGAGPPQQPSGGWEG